MVRRQAANNGWAKRLEGAREENIQHAEDSQTRCVFDGNPTEREHGSDGGEKNVGVHRSHEFVCEVVRHHPAEERANVGDG